MILESENTVKQSLDLCFRFPNERDFFFNRNTIRLPTQCQTLCKLIDAVRVY